MNTTGRLSKYIDYLGVKVAKFERDLGFSNGSISSQIKNGKSIGSDRLEKILEFHPELSARWLLTGRGEMLSTSEEYAPSSENQGQTILHLAKALQAAQEMINKLKDELDYERSRAGLHAGGVETDDPASVHAG